MTSQNQSNQSLLSLLSILLALLIAGAAVAMMVVPVQAVPGALFPVTVIVAALCLMLVALLGLRRAAGGTRPTVEQQPAAPTVEAAPPPPPRPKAAQDAAPAVMLLTLLQEKGRLVDFAMEDITAYSDEQVSAAARVVHQGCREVIRDAFDPAPISETAQNATVTLSDDYPAYAYRLTGNLNDSKPPVSGTVVHKGWQARKAKLPQPAREPKEEEARIIVPAEVEV